MALENRKIIGRDGDTLSKLAHDFLGDFEYWIIIADQNNIDAFTDLTGLELTLPTTEEIEGIVESVNTDFVNLTDTIKTVNNWKSLNWV